MAEQLTGKRGRIVMYVMTSEHTQAPTIEFFAKHKFFGAKRDNIVFFEQRMIPCFTLDGKIILSSPHKVARAPDGNGGIYWALKNEKVLEHMRAAGVSYLHAYCVDNVLVKVADPVFMGYCIEMKADSGNKVCEKFEPNEAVGVVCRVLGRSRVVEYSEIGEANSKLRRPDGKLVYKAGNICNHFFTTDFLQRVCDSFDGEMPQHVAKKKIPYVEADGTTATPTKANGIKLEKFIFDAIQFSDNSVVWECLREEEFSPLKNADAPGTKDTPTTSRLALLSLHREYLRRSGATIEPVGGEGDAEFAVEISPLVSYAGENLEARVGGQTYTKSPVIIDL